MSDRTPTPVWGIDLGTTYSCIAYVDEFNRATIVPNSRGDRTTPSVVQFSGKERVVGREAKDSALLAPDATVELVKRHMGKSQQFGFTYDGISYTPEEISSYILRKVTQDAERQTGMSIKDVVITCPAYFGIPERTATEQAGKIAGLNVKSIINEPTAAAISYGVNEQQDQTVLVYDLGGGTFDITVIRIEDGNIRVICTDGDQRLGGRDWDALVITYLAEEWQKQTKSSEDPLSSDETVQDLYNKAETAKFNLTGRDKTEVAVFHDGQRARVPLTRQTFESLTSGLLERTVKLTRDALEEAQKKGVYQFDQLLLVGGSSYMPQVTSRLRAEFNIEPKLHEPNESVAKGAAIFGHKLMLDEEIKVVIAGWNGIPKEEVSIETVTPDVLHRAQLKVANDFGYQLPQVKKASETKIQNVTSRSFGVIAYNPQKNIMEVSNLIRRNDPIPADATQRFGTMEANQESVLIQIVDNFSSDFIFDPADSRNIGEAEIQLPLGLPMKSPIEINFRLDEQGLLRMFAREVIGGREAHIEVKTEEGFSEEQLEEAKERASGLTIN